MMKREHEATRKDVWEYNILNSRHYNSPITYKLKLSGFMSEWKSHLVTLGNLAMEGIYHQPNQISSSVFSYYQVKSLNKKNNWKFLSLDISNLFEGAKDKFS